MTTYERSYLGHLDRLSSVHADFIANQLEEECAGAQLIGRGAVQQDGLFRLAKLATSPKQSRHYLS